MNSPVEDAHAYLEHRALLLLVVAVTVALGWVLLPFYGTLLWSAIIALLFAPLHRRLLLRLRHRRTLAALLTPWVAGMSLGFLALLGAVAAQVGGAGVAAGAWRVSFCGALAMAITAGVGALFGAVV